MPPPRCYLVTGDREIAGVQGSTVWDGMAVDRALEVPPERVVVSRGERLRFREERPNGPDEAFLSVYRAEDVPHPDRPAWEGPLDPDLPAWTTDLEPGSYILSLFRAWAGLGDVTHHFAVEIR